MSNNLQFSRWIYSNWLWMCCVRITRDLNGTVMSTLDWLNWMWTGLDSHTIFCQLNLFSDVKCHIIRKLEWAKYNLIPSSLVLYCIVAKGCHLTITSFTFKHNHSFKFTRCLRLSARLVALLCPFSAAIIVSSQPSCPLTRTASHHRRGGGVSEVEMTGWQKGRFSEGYMGDDSQRAGLVLMEIGVKVPFYWQHRKHNHYGCHGRSLLNANFLTIFTAF